MDNTHIRTRWAAVGAAVAITLGAGGIGLVSATSPAGAVAYVPIEPCRLADTRAGGDNVGPRNTPIGAAETLGIIAEGNNGNCVGIPTAATGLQLNVTAVNATAAGFLTIWGDGSRPTASSLNPTPGQPPIPNAVTTGLTAGGAFNVYNHAGTVEVIVDIVGYYTDHSHTGADIADGSIGSADIGNNSVSNLQTSNEPGIVYNSNSGVVAIGSTPAAAISTSMRVPSDGYVNIEVSGHWSPATTGATAWCQIQKGGVVAIDTGQPWVLLDDPGNVTGYRAFSAHRTMPIAVADNPLFFFFGQALSFVCDEIGGTVDLDDLHVTATFFATSYAPAVLIPFP